MNDVLELINLMKTPKDVNNDIVKRMKARRRDIRLFRRL